MTQELPVMAKPIALPADETLVRPTTDYDMDGMVTIEEKCFNDPWNEEDFKDFLLSSNCLSLTAEQKGHVVGFVVYEDMGPFFRIVNMATHPFHHRDKVGTRLMEKLKTYLRCVKSRIVLEVPETNLGAQLFFKAMGFKATEVRRSFYPSGLDAYHMEYEHEITG